MTAQQLALPLDDRPPIFRDDLCSCRPDCEHPAPAYHRINRGCDFCDCPLWPHPPEALDINSIMQLADGTWIRYRLQTHYLGSGTHKWPHVDYWGDLSPTGYRSMFPPLDFEPEEGWFTYIRDAAEAIRADYLKERRKRR